MHTKFYNQKKYLHIPIDNNLLAAIIICFSLINGAVGIANISYLTIIISWILFIYCLIEKKANIYINAVFLIIYILVLFLFSYLFVSDSTYTSFYCMHFLGFGIISLLIGMQKLEIDKVEYYVENIGLVCNFIFLLGGFESYDASLEMGIMYSMLPVFLVSISTLISWKWRVITILNILISLYLYITVAPRGCWLAVTIFMIIYIYHIISSKRGKTRGIIRITVITVIIIGIIYLYQNLSVVLNQINNIFSMITGNEIYAINKFLYLLSQENITNGRDVLGSLAIGIIKENWILGKGIGYFEAQSGGSYTHNIILQAICEAGIFLLMPILILLVGCSIYLLFCDVENKREYYFFLILFVNSIVQLFFSSVYWQNIMFWFFLGYTLKNGRYWFARRIKKNSNT